MDISPSIGLIEPYNYYKPQKMKNKMKNQKNKDRFISSLFLLILGLFGVNNPINAEYRMGGVNLGNLPKYHMVFTQGNVDANLQGSTRGFLGDIAINGIVASERTAGRVPYAGTMYTNDVSLAAWQKIVNENPGQSGNSLRNTTEIIKLTSDLENTFSQINSLTVTPGFGSVSAISLDGLNKKNGRTETFVINITSGFTISTLIKITGDATDVFIFRWDSDANFSNGYNGEVRFKNGGTFLPLGDLKASNFIHVAGDIKCSGGGNNPPAPYPQGPRYNSGQGPLINGGLDFTGGGFFTGYWFTTGVPTIFPAGKQPYGETGSLSNGIFVGGWYSKTSKFSLTSGSSGVYIAPRIGTGSIGNLIWNDADANGIQDEGETGIANVVVNLFSCTGTLVATTTSDLNGSYLFSNLNAGNYYLQFVSSTGNGFTLYKEGDDSTVDNDVIQDNGMTDCFTLRDGESNTSIDAGMNQNASIGNFVWNDLNKNGIQDVGEPGIVNAIIEIRTCTGQYVSSYRTNYDGYYLFTNIEPGNYYLIFTLPDGYVFTSKNQGSNSATDSDPDPSNGATTCFTLNPNSYNSSYDAGVILMSRPNAPITLKMSNNSLKNNATPSVIESGSKVIAEPGTDEFSSANTSRIGYKGIENKLSKIETLSYPNPFQSTTTLQFSSPLESTNCHVEIYSADGKKLAELYKGNIEANTVYTLEWNAGNLSNGTYIYKIFCGEVVSSGRLILNK